MLVNGGYAIGVPVIGLFYDMTGSYYPAWIVMGILAVLMTVSLLYSYQTVSYTHLTLPTKA